jgi:opacity protein-like surface antigen
MKRFWITTGLLTALIGAATLAPAVQAKGGDGTRIALKASSAYQGASGKAKSQTTGERELQVEVEHVRSLAGKRVNFFVNSTRIGSARISGLGAAQVTRRGSSFPAIQAGTVIKVKTAAGTMVVSGRF